MNHWFTQIQNILITSNPLFLPLCCGISELGPAGPNVLQTYSLGAENKTDLGVQGYA